MGQVGKSGAGTDLANEQDLAGFRRAQEQLDKMRIPVLLPAGNPHARLYIAALDGTGNSMVNDKRENWSVVARIYEQVRDFKKQYVVSNVAGGYVEGTFTQEGFLRTPERLSDGVLGHSFDERVETAYYQFCLQARAWLIEDPEAQIRLAGVGFSRGSEQVAALQGLINERGIRDPADAKVVRDQDDFIQKIQYADKPLLVAPGKTIQAALLFDPVSTGVKDEERVMPGSNLGIFEITAHDERRDVFANNDHVPLGLSQDGRDLNVTVAGAHSDIGNAYEKNGLGVLSFNLGVEFLNRLSDTPYLQKQVVPTDPAQFVIHRSDQHMMGLYGTRGYDRDGVRDTVENDQSPRPGIQQREPINPELEAQIKRRVGPQLPAERDEALEEKERLDQSMSQRSLKPDRAHSETDIWIDRAFSSYMGRDDQALSTTMAAYRESPLGQASAQQQQQFSAMVREEERAEELQQQAVLAEQQQVQQRAAVLHR